ncbi:MAG TPA: hypothetical protein VKA63_10970 [Candidatus Krumholzibacteria bacterium]|nr:hypothetical protein [Candidatus Krumholzibacteria bacterium]
MFEELHVSEHLVPYSFPALEAVRNQSVKIGSGSGIVSWLLIGRSPCRTAEISHEQAMIYVPAESREDGQFYSLPPEVPRRENQSPPVPLHKREMSRQARIECQHLVNIRTGIEQLLHYRWHHQGDIRIGQPAPELAYQRRHQHDIADMVQSDDQNRLDFLDP